MNTLPVRTIQPDYRYTDINQWKRYLANEIYHTSRKNLINKAREVLTERIKFVNA